MNPHTEFLITVLATVFGTWAGFRLAFWWDDYSRRREIKKIMKQFDKEKKHG